MVNFYGEFLESVVNKIKIIISNVAWKFHGTTNGEICGLYMEYLNFIMVSGVIRETTDYSTPIISSKEIVKLLSTVIRSLFMQSNNLLGT